MDQTKDRNYRELHRYSRLYPLPEYVKQASMPETCNPEGLPVTAYADVRTRSFPVHTKAATVLSWVYYLNKQSQLAAKFRHPIERRFAKAATYWGAEGDMEALKAKHASLHANLESQLPDDSFAIVWATTDGRKERHYQLTNPGEVKVAAEWFDANRDTYDFDDRQTIASKILEKAAEFGANVEEHRELLEKQAGHGVYDPRECAQAMYDRVNMVRAEIRQETADGMRKLAATVASQPSLAMDPAATANLCKTIDLFDHMAGLTTKYAEGLARPEDIVFAAPYYLAGEFVKDACELITGAVFSKDQLTKLALEEVRALLGDAIADEVSNGIGVDGDKMAEVAGTLDRGAARSFEQLMAEAGQHPVVKRASHEQFTTKELTDLAMLNRFIQKLPEPAVA